MRQSGRCWTFFLPGPKVRVLTNNNGGDIKTNTAFTVGNLGFFKCDCMPFRLCNVPAMFQWQMQNCLSELSLIYCLIYLENIIVFSQTAEEHLHWLCVVFDMI